MNKLTVTRATLGLDATNSPSLAPQLLQPLIEAAGGYTITYGMGAWRNSVGEVVRECVAIVEVAHPHHEVLAVRAALVAIGVELRQECIYVTEDGAEGELLPCKPAAPVKAKTHPVCVTYTSGRRYSFVEGVVYSLWIAFYANGKQREIWLPVQAIAVDAWREAEKLAPDA